MTQPNFKVGDEVYVFDGNTRVYEKDGVRHSSPIYRCHFVARIIAAETPRSWILGWRAGEVSRSSVKHSKKANDAERRFYTLAEVDEQVWIHENRYAISEAVGRCATSDKLREVARIIGYQEKKS